MSSQPDDLNTFGEWGRLTKKERGLGVIREIQEEEAWGKLPLKGKTLVERFTDKITISGKHWIWQGAINRGYGTIVVDGKIKYAHRVSHELFKGPIPDGHKVLTCDVDLCVNPSDISTAPIRTPRE